MSENILAPSMLSADFKILGEQLKETEEAGAQYIHFDVMDGIFVPSISFGMPVLSSVKGATSQVLDVHLMVTEPVRYVKEFAACGADIITIHLEACEDPATDLELLGLQGVQAPTAVQALAALQTQGTVILPVVTEQAGRLESRGEDVWTTKR